ncbi:hypothetical protein EDD21DRAFT_441263 [Dissophora ornata]|nr:hypothetical protein EDD21DRAFT_441263 [Dissophora ornata]
MKFFTALLILLIAAFASAQSPLFSNCTADTTDLTVTSFTMTPYPLCINQNVCITITGTLSEPITSGAALSMQGKYLSRVVYADRQDLCTVLAASGYSCPIPATTTSITFCLLVTSTIPNVPVILKIQATNGNDYPLFCVSSTITASVCSS